MSAPGPIGPAASGAVAPAETRPIAAPSGEEGARGELPRPRRPTSGVAGIEGSSPPPVSPGRLGGCVRGTGGGDARGRPAGRGPRRREFRRGPIRMRGSPSLHARCRMRARRRVGRRGRGSTREGLHPTPPAMRGVTRPCKRRSLRGELERVPLPGPVSAANRAAQPAPGRETAQRDDHAFRGRGRRGAGVHRGGECRRGVAGSGGEDGGDSSGRRRGRGRRSPAIATCSWGGAALDARTWIAVRERSRTEPFGSERAPDAVDSADAAVGGARGRPEDMSFAADLPAGGRQEGSAARRPVAAAASRIRCDVCGGMTYVHSEAMARASARASVRGLLRRAAAAATQRQ